MRRHHSEQAVTLRSPGVRGAFERDGSGPLQIALGNARRRAWAPLVVRAVAVALALVGLAGIGSVAGREQQLAGAPGAAGVGSSAQLAVLGAADPVLRFAGAAHGVPIGRSPAAQAPERGAMALEATQAAEPGSSAALPVGPGPLPCGAGSAPGEPSRIPRARPADAPARFRPPARERAAAVVASVASSAIMADGRVVLNRATASELMRLPGVGAKRAAAIVEQRERLGGFRAASELLRVKGIGPRTLERLLPQLVLD
jgi:competence protein ComEA